MAKSMIFHYQKENSLIHNTNVLVKLAGMLCFSILLVPVSLFRLVVIFFVILAAHLLSSIDIRTCIKEGRFFFILGLAIFIFNYISSESIFTAMLRVFRFFLILWMALLFTFTTDPLAVSASLYSIIKPFHFNSAKRFSTIIGLSLTILPLILDQIGNIKEAMLSRCGMTAKTPFKNIIRLGLPLIDGVLLKAKDLSDAMESRLFTENATPPEKQLCNKCNRIILLLLLSTAIILLGEQLIPKKGYYRFFIGYH